MHTLSVTLVNNDGLRLTVSGASRDRSVGDENRLVEVLVEKVNAAPDHGRYGPWTAVRSGWIS